MDPQAPIQPISPTTPPTEKKRISKKTLLIIGVLIGVILLGAGVVFAFTKQSEDEKAQTPTDETPVDLAQTPYVLLYGAWKGNNSVIYATDLSTKKEYELAILPKNIKKVTPISSTELLYIADTNDQDHGQSLKIRSLTTGEDTTIYSALDGYGIDDYKSSPNGQYIAALEVKFNPIDNILLGGNSKVITIDRQNLTTTNTLYEEVATQPIHYPIGVTNEGKVFLDTFLPNSGQGFGYGMSTSNLTGTTKTDIPALVNGSYGTQPVISYDGRYITAAGYNGNKGPGTEDINGFRRAILNPNTILILDTSTNEVSQIPNLSDQVTYPASRWGQDNNLLISIASPEVDVSGSYQLNIDTGVKTKNPRTEGKATYPVDSLENTVVSGVFDTKKSSIGNLGSTYAQPVSTLEFANLQTNTKATLSTSVPLMQFIALIPNSKISKTVLTKEIRQAEEMEASIQGNEISLRSFTFKPDLAPTREAENTTPPTPTPTPTTTTRPETPTNPGRAGGGARGDNITNPNPEPPTDTTPPKPACRDLYADQVLAACGVEPPNPPSDWSETEKQQQYIKQSAYEQCVDSVLFPVYGTDVCQGTPLYLYGPEGLNVNVKIHTPISNPNVPKGSGNGIPTKFSFTLAKNGTFLTNNQSYSSLSYDYQPAIFTKPPKYGSVVSVKDLEKKALEYAKSLGLNTRETSDLVQDLKSKARGEYVFLSFYPQEVSKFLLPITFSPVPDTYINYVFYMKNLTSPDKLGYSPKEPSFQKVNPRGTFTAVEISLISE